MNDWIDGLIRWSKWALRRNVRNYTVLLKRLGFLSHQGYFKRSVSSPTWMRLILGYREFLPVITAEEGCDTTTLRQEAIHQMKSHTRQYVKTQLNWINHKLIPQCHLLGHHKTPIYILDATDPTKWLSKVLNPA